MAENSAIGWTTHTFNPVVGCTKVSAACDFCYAAEYANKWEPLVTWGEPGTKSVLRRTSESNWKKPLAWDRKAIGNIPEHGPRRQRVFCASLSDVFDNDWEKDWRDDLWQIIAITRNLDWLLLTKRPQNVESMVPVMWRDQWPSNIWLGTTTENQTELDRRWPHVIGTKARVKFISYEPALGPLSFGKLRRDQMPDWVICGGESGTHRRPFDLNWAEQMRSQCEQFQIPFFFKQDSAFRPGQRGRASDALWACKEFPT